MVVEENSYVWGYAVDFRGKPRELLIEEILALRKQTEEFAKVDSDRRYAEAALRESEARFRGSFELGPIGMVLLTGDQEWIQFNDRFCGILGYTREQLNRTKWSMLIHPDDRSAVQATLKGLLNGEIDSYSGEMRFICRKDRVIFAHVWMRCIRREDRSIDHFIQLVEDITERKRDEDEIRRHRDHLDELVAQRAAELEQVNARLQEEIAEREYAENALREREKQLRAQLLELDQVYKFAPVGLFLLDRDMRFVRVNERMAEISGKPVDAHLGNTLDQVLPEIADHLNEVFRPVFEEGEPVVDIEVSGVAEDSSYVRRDWLGSYYPFKSHDGDIVGIIGGVVEITDRKRLELQLRQAQKMEAVGQLAGGIAHDFNNLLTGIIGNLGLAELDAPQEIRVFLSAAVEAAGRAEQLVRQLLAFSRKSPVELTQVDLNEQIERVSHLVREVIDRRIDIEVHAKPGLPCILADATQIDSILMNLCVNARDAINDVIEKEAVPGREGDRFVISLETGTMIVNGEYCRTHAYARPGEFVVLSVSDNGAGMDLETQRHIFEPFFTTKPLGEGTGLGLASAYGIIKQHGGWINLYSEPGRGTTFKIYLPIAERDLRENAAKGISEVRGGDETILLVDDEKMIRELGKTVLEKHGYTVLLAVDGGEALEIFHREGDRIDAIVLDLSMPHLSGYEVLQQLRSESTRVKVIVSSGYAENGQTRKLQSLNPSGYITKPYRPEGLLRIIREVLDVSDEESSK